MVFHLKKAFRKNPTGSLSFLEPAKKGVSPIVATALLIVISVGIALVVGTWAMNYTQTRLSNIESCSKVNIIYSKFDFDKDTGDGTITLQNVGGPIDGYRIYAFSEGNKKKLVKEVETPIEKSEERTERFGVDMENVKGIIVEVINCPGVRLIIPIS